MMATSLLPESIKIVEVGPRDGLQNEQAVSTEAKVALINQLSCCGLTHIEAGSFVSPKWVPQMADSLEVMAKITRASNVKYAALTPNMRGFEQAIDANADEVAVFTSSSQGFCQKNINCSIEESLERFRPLVAEAKDKGIPVRGYLSCIVDCPYDGPTEPSQVAKVAQALLELGCYEVSLGDTIGTGTPIKVANMLDAVFERVPSHQVAVHFHDTWGQALANIYQALQMGVHVVDSSVAGLGGCPYAAGASGNVATEDVVYLCQGLGIETGVDLHRLAQAGWEISDALGRQPTSKVSLALRR
ncbi:hydroxymethylglutaryl-CoA lyase [Vibrio neptunius]|uniref:hydroxymethylglutaryl-CoA lyase n=1 Tax=Vibrio neptunius TaxID=170651 RepID=A0ABS3A4H6_9VIBR|nr:hydroxymethylglutaryl-CoA lyase [Vibrio neptunius]MBN3494123.1 hydroxymethylglutaryl-CoA lyase [Vibrio neptunius]MBN3516881.1 hydroxymethylglutaryl-CoA lyase [Vibrio neptunius]MBN3550794.1 hydroxymethylglutaryl-CoA lyase [Vibrio neptunius]MBN3578925.1 hydroxymethylglutaryl-CoA lyase [Vibrio neptunius]MCH9872590.1 hydroxymethylglutaryl-CoA lyase [Vibrio neptunius]